MTTCPSCQNDVGVTDAHCRHCGTSLGGSASAAASENADRPLKEIQIPQELHDALAPEIQILRPIARGGMGVVFLGREPALRRSVVIKMLSPELAQDATARARFAREAEAAAAVTHPNVIEVYRVGELPQAGTSYIVMAHIDGETLDEEFAEGDLVPEAKVRHIVGAVASALARAHDRGLVHRDIKPSNIMIEKLTGRPVVLDFGISAALDPAGGYASTKLTVKGTTIGTPQYMSPEQAAGDVPSDKSDVYSLSAVAYRLLTGRPPFEDDSAVALMAAHLKDTPQPVKSLRPDLDPQFAELIDSGLAKNPDDRPEAEQIARALQAATQPVVEWPPPGLERLHGMGARGLERLEIGLIALLGCYFLLSLYATGSQSSTGGTALQDVISFLSAASLVISGLFLLAALSQMGRLNAMAWWGRRSGYPLSVAYDVGLDGATDTELLLNGLGSYASLKVEDGKRLMMFRRIAAVSMLVGAAVSLALVFMWIQGWVGTQAALLISKSQALVIAVPALAGIVLRRAFNTPERRVRRRYASEEPVRFRQPPLIAPELVGGWLGAAGFQRPAHMGRGRTYLGKVLSDLPLGLISFLALLSTLSLVLMTSIGMLDTEDRTDAVRLIEVLQSDDRVAWSMLDSALAHVAQLDNSPQRTDEAAGAELLLLASPSPPGSLYNVDSSLHPPLDIANQPAIDSTTLWQAWVRLPALLSDSVRGKITAAAGVSGLAIWRRFAASPSHAALWYARPGLLGGDGSLAFIRLRVIARYARNNSAAALLAVREGRFALAEQRGREIVAAGRHLAKDPHPRTHELGLEIVLLGTHTLTHVARLAERPSLAADATALGQLVSRRRDEVGLFGRRAAALGAIDPNAPEMMAAIRDTTRVPADRWSLIAGIADGHCASPRERISGASNIRHANLARAAELAADIPRTDNWVDLHTRRLELRSNPFTEDGLMRGESRLARLWFTIFNPVMRPMVGAIMCEMF